MRHFAIDFIWDWELIGIGVDYYTNAETSNYHRSIDIQILYLNILIRLFEKNYRIRK